MKRLIVLPDLTVAHRIVWALEEAGIDAAVQQEEQLLAAPQYCIWLADKKQDLAAREIASSVLPMQFARDFQCPNCKYDMRGHGGRVECPECGTEVYCGELPKLTCARCGHEYEATVPEALCPSCHHSPNADVRDTTCPKCGEQVPQHFESCWNCGLQLTKANSEIRLAAPIIHRAKRDNLPTILTISNHYAQTTPANFAVEPESLEQWQLDFDATHKHYPWLVAIGDGGAVVGFAKASPWKGRCAYAYSAEITVYLQPELRSRGFGRALYEKLFAVLRAQGYRTILAGITLPNEPSVRLHESMGMKRVALLERVGWKFDRWHDVGYWEAQLVDSDAPPTPMQLVADVARDCEL